MDPRPVIRCLVAWELVGWRGTVFRIHEVSLEESVEYRKLGYRVLVDPVSEAALARWEQLNRPRHLRW